MLQEVLFPFYAPAIVSRLAISLADAMTGDDERSRITGTSVADGACGVTVAYSHGNFKR